MTEDDFFGLIDPPLRELGSSPEVGEEFRAPALDVLRYHARGVRMSWIPWFGRGLSVVAVARRPADLGGSALDYQRLLTRLSMAANGRFPPWGRGRHAKGLVLGLTAVVLTPELIGPNDEATLEQAIADRPASRHRAVPLGILQVNLDQEALAFALAAGPDGLFTEPAVLADALTPHLRRYVPFLQV